MSQSKRARERPINVLLVCLTGLIGLQFPSDVVFAANADPGQATAPELTALSLGACPTLPK